MLFRKQFGGSHESGLTSVVDRREQGSEGDDGFTTSHVALQEQVHGLVLLQVGHDFPQDFFLCRGELELKKLDESAYRFAACLERKPAPGFPGVAFFKRQCELDEEEFLEDQPHLGRRMKFFQKVGWSVSRGEVGKRQRIRPLWELVPSQNRFRKKLFGQFRVTIDHIFHDGSQRFQVQAFRRVVDGDDTPDFE